MIGDKFVEECDIEKEVVKSEMEIVKKRWERINKDMLESKK